jgi:hypothetical protein
VSIYFVILLGLGVYMSYFIRLGFLAINICL